MRHPAVKRVLTPLHFGAEPQLEQAGKLRVVKIQVIHSVRQCCHLFRYGALLGIGLVEKGEFAVEHCEYITKTRDVLINHIEDVT